MTNTAQKLANPFITNVELEATPLRDGKWAVRPKGQLGTCGFHPIPWTVQYIRARSAAEAIRKAK